MRNSEFRIVFTGTYSSGKSTIINTLIRHRVLPRTDETTTTRVCKIIHESMDRNCIKLEALDINGNILVAREFDNDEACLNCFETITPAGQKETNPADVVSIFLYMDLSHLYPECNREEMSKRFKLVLVDTPGTDSSNSVSFVSEDSDELRNADKDIALDVVNGNGREMIILCAQKDHYQSESISDVMYAIHKAAQNGYNGFNDRFLFVMNKCDSDDPSFNPAKQKQLFATHLSNSEHWRARNVYLNPRIFMTTAIWEERIQAGVPFYTEDERFDDINKYDLFENYKRYQFMVSKEQPRYLLAPLCDLPEYRKVEMQNTFALALSEGREVDAVSIQTGIPCIVSAIQEYIERYAYPVKIRALLKTFDTLLEVITNKTNEQNRILDSINKDLGESSSEREGVQADQSKKEEERKALDYLGKRIEDQKGKIERIEPSGSMQSVSERFIIMKSDIRKKLDDVDYERKIRHDICVSRLPDSLKVLILKYLNRDAEKTKAKYIAEIAYRFFDAEDTLNSVRDAKDIEQWKLDIISKLKPDVKAYAEDEISLLLAMLLREHYLAHSEYKPLYLSYMEYIDTQKKIT